jgi:hypothetical protein
MKCRHCSVEFHDHWVHFPALRDKDGHFRLGYTTCPACNRLHVAYTRADGWQFMYSCIRGPFPGPLNRCSGRIRSRLRRGV